ncbi:MAG: porin, partial [Xanthomonadales bacterium]|nr:porin [Xanthomonadales bacterium]
MSIQSGTRSPSAGMLTRRPLKGATLLAAAVALGLASWAGPATADSDTPSLEEMWQVIQNQQAEIDSLKDQNAQLREKVATPAPAPAPVAEAAPAPQGNGSGTRIDVYGAAMLDMGYQFNQNDPDWFDVVRPTKLPSYANEFGDDGEFFAGVRQSRLGVKSFTPTSLGELKTIFEFELFGVGADAGQTTFRLRHAWGELGQFGAGQTWSTFMDIDVFPNSIEYWGPSGMVFYRNVQARWTPWSDGDSNIMMSLEKPGGSGDGGRFADRVELEGVSSDFELPDLSAHYRYSQDWGHVQVAGILRQIKWND